MIGSIGSSTSLVDFSALRQQREAKMFKEMDTDSSGSVSKDEFSTWDQKMRAQMSGTGGASNMPSADDVFSQADTDGSGGLSASEFSSLGKMGGPRGGPPPGPPPGGGAQGGGDAGSSSGISSLLDALNSAASDSTDSTSSTSSSSALDANGDGKISIKELVAWIKSYAASQGGSSQTTTGSNLELTA